MKFISQLTKQQRLNMYKELSRFNKFYLLMVNNIANRYETNPTETFDLSQTMLSKMEKEKPLNEHQAEYQKEYNEMWELAIKYYFKRSNKK